VTLTEPSDCYEVLQVSRNATPLIVTKAYRVLAALYHPDNAETGNAEAFTRLVEAHGILTDPIRRAAYDRERFGACAASTVQSGVGNDPRATEVLYRNERELRRFVLLALYTARRNRPSNPAMPLGILAELFGSSIDEMQFTIWYLRGKKLIETRDDGVAITVSGVDHVEALGWNQDGLFKPLPSHSPLQQADESDG
jgi:curved DNA-binding protein CbpA